MNLLERVSTLIRANLNDLIDRAEEPEKMVKQVLLDMHNQLIQVKTQVAIAIADEHKLERRHQENAELAQKWEDKAGLAVDKGDDELAKEALERRNAYRTIAEGFRQQWQEQCRQVEVLKDALSGLEAKIHEAEMKKDLLIAQNRRAVGGKKVMAAHSAVSGSAPLATFKRMEDKISDLELRNQAEKELAQDSVEARFAKLEREDRLEHDLAEFKARRQKGPGAESSRPG